LSPRQNVSFELPTNVLKLIRNAMEKNPMPPPRKIDDFVLVEEFDSEQQVNTVE